MRKILHSVFVVSEKPCCLKPVCAGRLHAQIVIMVQQHSLNCLYSLTNSVQACESLDWNLQVFVNYEEPAVVYMVVGGTERLGGGRWTALLLLGFIKLVF